MRFAARRDENDKLLTEAMRKAGFTVHDLGLAGHGVPDKLVTKTLPNGKPWAAFVEIKTLKGKLREGQHLFQETFEPHRMYYLAREPEPTIRWLFEAYTAAIRPEELG